MYKTLNTLCSSNGIAATSFTKYPCPSLPLPLSAPAQSPYENVTNTSFQLREPFHASSSPYPHPPLHPPQNKTFLHLPPDHHITSSYPNKTKLDSSSFSFPINDKTQTEKKTSSSPNTTTTTNPLLPVLDCRFNLREMCKQSILLEDHLSHQEKRCLDCCIKHFLFLEGLCEEAITLDKEGIYTSQLQTLCHKIRQLQKLFLDDPIDNSHLCSQELRNIRKLFQPEVFGMIFNDHSLSSSCSGYCSL